MDWEEGPETTCGAVRGTTLTCHTLNCQTTGAPSLHGLSCTTTNTACCNNAKPPRSGALVRTSGTEVPWKADWFARTRCFPAVADGVRPSTFLGRNVACTTLAWLGVRPDHFAFFSMIVLFA